MTGPVLRATAPCSHAVTNAMCERCTVRGISICAALSSQELEALAALARETRYGAGETLAEQGEPADALWNLTDGMVRMTRTLPDGRRQILGFLMPGDFLGLSLQSHYSFSAEAIGAVRTCRFDAKRFEALLRTFPHLLRRLLDAASHELGLSQEHIVALGRQTAEERVAGLLISLRNRRRALGGDDATIPLPMTRQDIADHLGLTVETVSRTLTRLSGNGTLRLGRNTAAVLSQRRLEELAAH
jgi:CRP/FNR family transcriptional regulator